MTGAETFWLLLVTAPPPTAPHAVTSDLDLGPLVTAPLGLRNAPGGGHQWPKFEITGDRTPSQLTMQSTHQRLYGLGIYVFLVIFFGYMVIWKTFSLNFCLLWTFCLYGPLKLGQTWSIYPELGVFKFPKRLIHNCHRSARYFML